MANDAKMDPRLCAETFDILKPMVVKAITDAAGALGGSASSGFVAGLIANIDKPWEINKLYASKERAFWRWVSRTFQVDLAQAVGVGAGMRVVMYMDMLQREKDVSPDQAAKFLFDQIRSTKYSINHGRKPDGIHMMPRQYRAQNPGGVGPVWKESAADWITPDLTGLASAILFQLQQDAMN